MMKINPEKYSRQYLDGSDAEFFARVWQEGTSKFQKRLVALGFTDLNSVLDAGFGMGQWIMPMSRLNKNVSGIEYSQKRVDLVRNLTQDMGISNLHLLQGSVENLPYESNFFDGIFSYGVVFLTHVEKTLKEFFRVAKPDAKLYFTMNGLGWYLKCLIDETNKSENYDPGKMAVDTLKNTFNYLAENTCTPGSQLFVTKQYLSDILTAIGFTKIIVENEGHINLESNERLSFYSEKSFMGQDFIYDIYCRKPEN